MSDCQERRRAPRSILFGPALLLFGVAGPACVGDRSLEQSEHVGTTRQAVGGGTDDNANDFPHTAALFYLDGFGQPTQSSFCSSFLATSRFVVTAAHCFNNPTRTAANPGAVSLSAVFATQAAAVTAPDSRIRSHVFNGSNPILRNITTYMDPHDDRAIARDVAVIPMDFPVPSSIANPIRPAGLTTPACANEFDSGTVVGFGFRSLTAASGRYGIRNFSTSDGWRRDLNGDGTQNFLNDFSLFSYDGTLGGDSGGPLMDRLNNRICGVNSSNRTRLLDETSFHPALDSEDNSSFLRDILMGKDGFFLGEHPGTDRDNDGISDVDDNCPNIANPDQRDTDGDGTGDRCDNCRFVKNGPEVGAGSDIAPDRPHQPNSNFAEEFALRGPQPHFPEGPATDDFIELNWPGDACDPTALTVTTSNGPKFAPAGNPRSVSCIKHPGFFCTGSDEIGSCELSRGNGIVANEFLGGGLAVSPTPAAPLLPTIAATTAKRGISRELFCKCGPGLTDAACQTMGCSRANVVGPSPAAWMTMTLADPAQSGVVARNVRVGPFGFLSPFLQSTHPPIGAPGQSARSEDWGWAYWLDFDNAEIGAPHYRPDPSDPTNPVRTRPEIILDGLVWSWVRALAEVTKPFPRPDATPTGSDGEQRLRQNISRIQVSEAGNSETRGSPCRTLRDIRAIDKSDCIFCQGGIFLQAFIDAVNPNPLLVSPGRWTDSAEGQVDASVIQALQDPSRTFVLASDDRAWASGNVRGVVLGADRAIQMLLATGTHGEFLEYHVNSNGSGGIGDVTTDTRARASAATAAQKPFLAVLSGHRHDVAFLERDVTGSVMQRLRTFDFDLLTEVIKPIHGMLRLVDPVAMTYRAEDDAYYILDRTLDRGPSAALYRLPRGNSLELLGTWRRPGNLTEIALTTGADGTLVITTWDDKKHAIAVLDLDATDKRGGEAGQNAQARRIKVVSLRFGKGAVDIPAHRNLDGLTLVVRAGDGTLVPTRISPEDPKSKDDADDAVMSALERAF